MLHLLTISTHAGLGAVEDWGRFWIGSPSAPVPILHDMKSEKLRLKKAVHHLPVEFRYIHIHL